MTTTLVVFPFSCNNTHFNDAKAGDQYTLKPHVIEILDDDFEDEKDFKDESSYEDYLNKRTISCVLFEMVKDEVAVHHTGFTKDDTEQARKEKIEADREKEKKARIARRKELKKMKAEDTTTEDGKWMGLHILLLVIYSN